MTRHYTVYHPQFGEVLKAADSIAEARAWAKAAFGPEAIVSQPYRHCERCDSAPCECVKHTLIVAADAAGKTQRILRQVVGRTVLS